MATNTGLKKIMLRRYGLDSEKYIMQVGNVCRRVSDIFMRLTLTAGVPLIVFILFWTKCTMLI